MRRHRIPRKSAPRPALLRPASRLTSAEATACRRAINLRRSVLGAIRTLRARGTGVKWLPIANSALCDLFFTAQILASRACALDRTGPRVSPSRVRFRPPPRLTFRFRVRPPGRASSYSRPVLGAAAIYALEGTLQGDPTTETPQIANDREVMAERASTSSSRVRARASGARSPCDSRATAPSLTLLARGRGAARARRPRDRAAARTSSRATSASAAASRGRSRAPPTRSARSTALVAASGLGGPNGEDDEGGDRFDDLVADEPQRDVLLRAARRSRTSRPGPDARHVVVLSSILARIAVPGYTGYSASKAGLLGLVRSFAAELAPRDVQVNAICPGWVDTDMAWQGLDAAAAATRRHARGRLPRRDDATCRSGACRSRRTSPAPSPGSSRRTRAASPARRSTRTAAPGWG